jgi:uracil phosphoribosyltransferase
METINLSLQPSVLGQYMAELRDRRYQQNRTLFRNNIRRIGPNR